MDLSPSPVESFGADLPALLQRCAPDVHPQTLTKLVWTESTAQPYAIGVVGARLERQPRNLPEAVATVRELRRQGLRFSAGLGQIMVDNWAWMSTASSSPAATWVPHKSCSSAASSVRAGKAARSRRRCARPSAATTAATSRPATPMATCSG